MFDKSTKTTQYNNSNKSISLEDSAKASLLTVQIQNEPLIMPKNPNRVSIVDKQMIKLQENQLKVINSNYESIEKAKRSETVIKEIKESIFKSIIIQQLNKNEQIIRLRIKQQEGVEKLVDHKDNNNANLQVYRIKKIKKNNITTEAQVQETIIKKDSKIIPFTLFGLSCCIFILYKLKRK